MDRKELRCGNWIDMVLPDKTVRTQFDFDMVKYLMRCQPIPITPEILETCGFVDSLSYWVKDKMYLTKFYQEGGGSPIICFNNSASGTMVELKHLHQLMNLYYALTGTELTVNLK